MHGITDFTSFSNNVTRQETSGSRRNYNSNWNNTFKNNLRSNYHKFAMAVVVVDGDMVGEGTMVVVHAAKFVVFQDIPDHAYQAEEYRGGNSTTTHSYNNDTNLY